MIITYEEMMGFWRETKNALIYEDCDGFYLLKLPYKSMTLESSVAKPLLDEHGEFIDPSEDFEYFESIKHLLNKPIFESDDIIWTHDFTDVDCWPSPTDSFYKIEPEVNSVLELHEPRLICDKDLNLNSNDIFNVLWVSLASSCPASGSAPTAYNDIAFVPGVGGWVLRERPWPDQEVNQYLYLNAVGDPQYAAIEFKYSSLDDLIFKSNPIEFGNRIKCAFAYRKPTKLRSSLNERIECWLSTENPLLSPNGVKARAVFSTISYAEF